MGQELRYTVLAYEDDYGIWLKIPDIGLMCCTEDVDIGLDILDEGLAARRWAARQRGDDLVEMLDRTVRWVGKEEFGPTQREIDQEQYEEEMREEAESEHHEALDEP